MTADRAFDSEPSATATPTTPDGADQAMVQTFRLSKSYGDFSALSDCDLAVQQGEIFGLLGPNGAGKTTLIRSLLGYLRPTSGHSLVAGIDPQIDPVEVRRQVAYLPGDARLPRHMNGKGVLEFFAEIHPFGELTRSLSVAEALELDLSRRVAFMSTGMRQKLALAVVFGPRTPILILDEPTANLDPTVRGQVLEEVMGAGREGRTVMLSSHVLSEIEQTCARVAFLRRGQLAHQLTMSDLFQRHRLVARLRGMSDSRQNGHDGNADPIETDGGGDGVGTSERSSSDFPAGIEKEVWKVPEELKPSVELVKFDGRRVQIETAGDLQPVLPWLASLPLEEVRIEPLGLHAVYRAVHFGDDMVRAVASEQSSHTPQQSDGLEDDPAATPTPPGGAKSRSNPQPSDSSDVVT